MSACGRGRGLAAMALVALALAGCGGSGSDGVPTLTIYLSAPAGGGAVEQARSAFERADAGGDFELALEVLDGPTDEGTAAALVRAGENARVATSDSTAIAYIGEPTLPATETSLPITNEARLLHVSTAGTPKDLGRFEPSGETNFAAAANAGVAVQRIVAAIGSADDPASRESVVAAYPGIGE